MPRRMYIVLLELVRASDASMTVNGLLEGQTAHMGRELGLFQWLDTMKLRYP